MVIFEHVSKEDVLKLKGWTWKEPATAYEDVRLTKKGVTLVLYSSGKMLLQGKPEAVQTIAKTLHLGKLVMPEPFRKEAGWIIGSDESLKGDTFGGLVVAAVKANAEGRQKLEDLGVKDSKLLRDTEIVIMAKSIKRDLPCEVRSILPEEYNQEGNVTRLLNALHQECRDYLQPGKHVIDKYPGCAVGDLQLEKAESKYLEVAAASVLARAAALEQLDYLSRIAGFSIPKGSTHVALALHELKERKLEFRKFVKMEFGNVKEFLK